WQTLSDEEFPFSQNNVEPIGSGPYKVKSVKRNPAGLAYEYELELDEKYRNTGHIRSIIFRFYQNEEALVDALKNGDIMSTAYLSERWLSSLDRDKFDFVSEPLPRVFSIFMNQNRTAVLRDAGVRQALEVAIDRQELVERAVGGFGRPTESPLPAEWLEMDTEADDRSTEERIAEATNKLVRNGWTRHQTGRWEQEVDGATVPLVLPIRSANGSLFEKMASYLTETWQALGVEATFEFYEQGDLVQTII